MLTPGLVAGVDHPLAVPPAGGHRLLGHHVPAGGGHLDGLVGMETAGGGQDDDVRVGVRQEGVQGPESRGPRARFGRPQGGRVDVAHPHQLGPVPVPVEGIEVVGGDPTAAHQGKPDLAIADERLGDEHGLAGERGVGQPPKYKREPCLRGIAPPGMRPQTTGVWRKGEICSIL